MGKENIFKFILYKTVVAIQGNNLYNLNNQGKFLLCIENKCVRYMGDSMENVCFLLFVFFSNYKKFD